MGEQILFCLAGIFVAGIVAQWVAWRIRVPAIILLLGTGLLLGPVLQVLQPDEIFGDLLLPCVTLGVAVIVFEGGLGLRFRELRGVRIALVGLMTIGVAVTWIGVMLSARFVLGLSWPIAAILGAIMTVTGPTVVGPLLRDVRLSGRLGALLRWEGIVIDPVGAVLAALTVLVVRSGYQAASPLAILAELLATFLIGAALGCLTALLLVLIFRGYFAPDRLQNPITLATVLGLYGFADWVHHEAGLVAVTVLGIALANQRSVPIKKMVEFKEALVVILLSGLFVVLGARIRPDKVLSLGGAGLLFLACMVFLVRPLAAFASTIGSGLSTAERTFLAAMAPRGVVAVAVASVFTLELAAAKIEGAELLLSATILTVIGTVVIYGLVSPRLASRLGLVDPNPQGILFIGASAWVRKVAKVLKEAGVVVTLIDTDSQNISAARMLGLGSICGSALSEQLIDELDTTRTRRLIAVTPNTELNALVCQRYAELFGREEVYHLSAGPQSGRRVVVAADQRGREFLTPEWTATAIAQQFGETGVAKATKLTDKFGYAEWLAYYGKTILPVFLVRPDGSVIPFTDTIMKPQPGDVVVALHTPDSKGSSSSRRLPKPDSSAGI